MIERQLRLTGIFTGTVFLAGSILGFVQGLATGHGVLTCLAHPSVNSTLVISILFFASAKWPKIFWVQPVVFLALTPVALVFVSGKPDSFYGLSFFVFAMAMLYRMGFFITHKIPKLVASLAYLLAVEIFALIAARGALYEAFSAIFFIIAFLLFFYLMFQDKLMVFLSAPKEKLSLSRKGLSEAEVDYIMAVVSGKSVKETAFDAGVSESTVRNMLARSYVKLGVTNRAGLSALAEKYAIVK